MTATHVRTAASWAAWGRGAIEVTLAADGDQTVLAWEGMGMPRQGLGQGWPMRNGCMRSSDSEKLNRLLNKQAAYYRALAPEYIDHGPDLPGGDKVARAREQERFSLIVRGDSSTAAYDDLIDQACALVGVDRAALTDLCRPSVAAMAW
jgi:hypothetical protein